MKHDGGRDWDLLQQYARHASQDAFAEIVRRYVDLVYATCLRDLHDHQLAEDATQAVFLVFARKAGSLGRETVLAGWLYQTARLVARNARKKEVRRKLRERRAADMVQHTATREPAWEEIEPRLNQGLDGLGRQERDAVLLHFLQGMTHAQVGASMGISEDAARMRTSRGLRKLRSFFTRRGPALSVGALATLLATNAAQAAPVGCSANVLATLWRTGGAATLTGSAATTLANATMHSMWAAKVKIASAVVAASLLVPVAGVATWQALRAQPQAQVAAKTIEKSVQPQPAQRVADSPRPVVAQAPAPAVPIKSGGGRPVQQSPAPTAPKSGEAGPAKPSMPPSQRKTEPVPAPPPKPAPEVKPNPLPEVKPAPPPKPAVAAPAGMWRFRMDVGLLVVDSNAPVTSAPVKVTLPGLPGQTFLTRTPSSLSIENSHSAQSGEETHTKVTYQPGVGLSIQRKVKPKSGKQYGMLLRQSYRDEPNLKSKPGQVVMQITRDGGENWNAWAADDFPRFADTYPLAYQAHLGPVLREFAARQLCRVPATVARQVLTESVPRPQAKQPLADIFAKPEAEGPALLWRREIQSLRKDTGFLLECLEADDLDVRKAALKRLGDVTGKPLEFDVSAPPEKRRPAVESLRKQFGRVSCTPHAPREGQS